MLLLQHQTAAFGHSAAGILCWAALVQTQSLGWWVEHWRGSLYGMWLLAR
jgi:hypothetical protein